MLDGLYLLTLPPLLAEGEGGESAVPSVWLMLVSITIFFDEPESVEADLQVDRLDFKQI